MNDLLWFWEIKRAGCGPHYSLLLEFEMDEAELERLVEPFLLRDYERSDIAHSWMHRNSREWDYTSVEIRGGQMAVMHGWGNDKPSQDEFVQAFLISSPPQFVRWRVVGGGDGYGPRFFRSGTTVASLLAYCHSEPQEPDFPKVLQQLEKSLSQCNATGKYALGKAEFERGMMRVPVFYDVPCVDGTWQSEPAGSELIPIAREVSDECDVAALASATSLHAPANFQQIIGGAFYFGAPRND